MDTGRTITGFVLAVISWIVFPVLPAIIALVLVANQPVTALKSSATILSWINLGVWFGVVVLLGSIVFLSAVLG